MVSTPKQPPDTRSKLERIAVPDLFKPVAERLQAFLSDWGFDFDLDLVDILCLQDTFEKFREQYDIDTVPDGEWLKGGILPQRWGIRPECVIAHLTCPVYLRQRDGQMLCITDRISHYRMALYSSSFRPDPWYSDLWFLIPAHWWLKRKHVEFVEQSPEWLTVDEVLARWGKRKKGATPIFFTDLQGYVATGQLQTYSMSMMAEKGHSEGIYAVDRQRAYNSVSIGNEVIPPLSGCKFAIHGIQQFERDHPELGFNLRYRDKMDCIDLVAYWLRENPKPTQAEAIKRLRDYPCAQGHDDDTLKGYLKALPLDRSGGRPRKKTTPQE